MSTNIYKRSHPCPCGSGKDSSWQHDARGIPLCRTCDICHERKIKGYRPEVLTNPQYEADEPIYDDEWGMVNGLLPHRLHSR